MIRPLFSRFFFASLVCASMFVCATQASLAATLSFDPSSAQVKVGETTTLQVKVNAGTSEILGVDAMIEYDKNLYKVESISDGTFLTVTTKDSGSEGKIYIAGAVESAGESVTGSGILASIKLKALANGTSSVRYVCELGETGESNISEASIDATDLIECSQNGQATLVSSGGATGSSSTGSTSSASTRTRTTQLPQTGVVQDMVVLSMFIGGALFIIGAGAKVLEIRG